ncbi:MAG: flagellar hook-associated protein FlgK [Betaproteobacteria bacterium]|nr:flagellar hook-associated protein FlgK [Betaproteobacteria bacterium]
MPTGLQHILNMGGQSLGNSRMGIEVTGHNIANAQTPGYSRQRADIEANDPTQYGSLILGQGAKVSRIARAHNEYLEQALRRETQNHGRAESFDHNISRLEGYFNPDLNSTIRMRLDTFGSALRDFANMPEEPAMRIHLLETANTLTTTVNVTHSNVAQLQNDISEELAVDCDIVSQKLKEVANLNREVLALQMGDSTRPNDLEDRRDMALKELSQLMDVQMYKDDRGLYTVRGPGGHLLVEGIFSAEVRLDYDVAKGQPRIIASDFANTKGADITAKFTTGKISGMLDVRDKHAQKIRDNLNEFAQTFGQAFNQIHEKGFGRGGFSDVNGREFFEGVDGQYEAAQQISVSRLIQQDTDAIAAGMSPLTPGDNVIVNELIKTLNKPMFDKGTNSAVGFYDNFVATLGSAAMSAKNELKASQVVKANVETQKERVSGVSLDEEAANMLKYQHLFTASSKIITTADEMFKTVLDLKR